jgi:hypothetical protein
MTVLFEALRGEPHQSASFRTIEARDLKITPGPHALMATDI